MECATIREALSAQLDGEAGPVAGSVVDQHLGSCPACMRWLDRAEALHRTVRVRPAEAVPDLAATILERATAPHRRTRVRQWWAQPVSTSRWALLTVALTQLVLAAPALLGDGSGASVHVSRELGAFTAALAAGLLVAAVQPARAWGLLPLAAVLALVLAGTAGLDLLQGEATTLREGQHLLDVAGVGLLWAVAREGGPAVGLRPQRAT